MSNLNIKPSTIYCHDNLEVLQGINTGCIDLIYLDPPFNKKKIFTAPVGSSADGASFSDIFRQEDIKDEWVLTIREDNIALYELLDFAKRSEGRTSYNFCYLAYMAIRLLECYRVLKETGSIYLHCDPTMSHYLKLALDCIFGEKMFRNEIVWDYQRWTGATSHFQRMHDIILFYAKEKHELNILYEKYSEKSQHKGQRFSSVVGGKINQKYISTKREKSMRDVWSISIINSQAKERTGYPTQKPLVLLERIIKASSNENDVVLDPFCGCATTCIAAEKLERQWIGIDVSKKAHDLVVKRLQDEVPADMYRGEPGFKTNPPTRTENDLKTTEKKYVYIISHPNFKGEYKVGIAKDWKSRLNSYQTSDPERAYKSEYTYQTIYYREIEKHIHAKFDNKHEWVTANIADIKSEIENWTENKSEVME